MSLFILELKRALKEKNFLSILLFLIVMSVLITIPNFLPEKLSVLQNYKEQAKLSYYAYDMWRFFLNSRPMTTFIALFPILIYSHSFIDDTNYKYSDNIILRIGFKSYFINKLLVCMILGGVLLFIVSITSFGLYNLIYTNAINDKFIVNFAFMNRNIYFYNSIYFVLFISLILFFTGMLYAAFGFLISLYTDNKTIIYGLGMLSLNLYEDLVYFISRLLGLITNTRYTEYYFMLSIFNNLGSYTDWKLIFIYIFLFVIILYSISAKYKKINLQYLRG